MVSSTTLIFSCLGGMGIEGMLQTDNKLAEHRKQQENLLGESLSQLSFITLVLAKFTWLLLRKN